MFLILYFLSIFSEFGLEAIIKLFEFDISGEVKEFTFKLFELSNLWRRFGWREAVRLFPVVVLGWVQEVEMCLSALKT